MTACDKNDANAATLKNCGVTLKRTPPGPTQVVKDISDEERSYSSILG